MTNGPRAGEVGLEPLPDLTRNVLDTFDAEAGALRGSRCRDCGRQVFPAAWVCFVCRGDDLESVLLPTNGTLYTFTWVAKKDPADSYGLGYVDLDEDVRLLARLKGAQDEFACDLPVRVGSDGERSWHFEPATALVNQSTTESSEEIHV